MSQEILTLQFGNYSNFVGSHYWNIQQKKISEVHEHEAASASNKLHRECLFEGKLSYRPRLIYFDQKSNLKALKEDGSFNDEHEDMELEASPDTQIYQQTQIKRSTIDDNVSDISSLDKQMSAWSDYLTMPLHGNSCQVLTQFYNDGKEFDFFGVGLQEYEKLYDDIEDKLHFWVEECNSLEGFQIFSDIHNGFGGLSAKLVQDLHEEYGKKSCLSYINWPVFDDAVEECYQDLNVALTFQAFQEHCSLYVLQSLQKDLFEKSKTHLVPNISYEACLPYHTSAILATAIESTTLPWRKEDRSVSLSELCHSVCNDKWKLAGSSLSFSHFLKEDCTLFDCLLRGTSLYGPLLTGLFPRLSTTTIAPNSHYVVLQNIEEHAVIPVVIHAPTLQALQLNRNIFTNNPLSVLDFFNERFHPSENTMSRLFYDSNKLHNSAPFPRIFSSEVEDQNVSVASSVYTSQEFYGLLNELVKRVQRINLHKQHALIELGYDQDLMNELREDLLAIARCYDAERTFNELES